MGDIVDHCWTNLVNDSRTQDLEVLILGSAIRQLADIHTYLENGAEYIFIEDKKVMIAPENFKLIVPKGGLKGYESHKKNINTISIL